MVLTLGDPQGSAPPDLRRYRAQASTAKIHPALIAPNSVANGYDSGA